MRRFLGFALAAAVCGFAAPRRATAGALTPDGRAGTFTAVEGVAVVRPVGRERWTALQAGSLVFPGDLVRVETAGANAAELRLLGGARLVLGPGALVEVPDGGGVRLLHGDVEAKAPEGATVRLAGPGGFSSDAAGTAWVRASERETKSLPAQPKWLEGYRASTSEEWMGSLLAKVDGKEVPLSVGYHKVTVEIRDQIARTTVEESFWNATEHELEGTFTFPLPADASISGFGMWIGDELVEADVVERQKARRIYEDILRRKKDPGLLEWEGGNLFKTRVYPIPARGEKRVRLRYTEVLPKEGDVYRWRYALRSELLRAHPVKELSISCSVSSTPTLKDVSSPTHPVAVRKTDHEAVVEFSAQQYAPDRDFEVRVEAAAADAVSVSAHRRGDNGFFLIWLSVPDDASLRGRRLAPDGAPLDLLLVADTSGSMNPASRAVQAQVLRALLAQCSERDRFRLVACDVAVRWLVENPTAATPENAAKALAALNERFSLGWTDLERAFSAVLPKAGAGTQVVYVGDGIPTAGDADASATARRLREAGKDSAATVHAVSTSAAYEKPVLEAMASIGGGSVRRAEGGATAAAQALLEEVARPALKGGKVEIEGLKVAALYPSVVPSVAPGGQVALLGRFLPEAGARTAKVTVTGTVSGAPVRLSQSFAVPAAAEEDSFLPRLWARRHLDALLERPQDAATKEEIVAFSGEYQILTPYTSFLVLENDEDRAKYGVERTVHMRDAERFFTDARDKAALETARKRLAAARTWRRGLRRAALREIEGLGRDLVTEVAYGGLYDFASRDTGLSMKTSNLSEYRAEDNRLAMGAAVPMAAAPVMDACCAKEADGDPPTEESFGEGKTENAQSEAEPAAEASDASDEEGYRTVLFSSGKDSSRLDARRRGYGYAGDAPMSPPPYFRRPGGDGSWSAQRLGVPDVPAPAPPRPRAANPAWDPAVLAALRSLDRRPALAALEGGLRVASETASLHPLRGSVESLRRAAALVTLKRWLATSGGPGDQAREDWVGASERGVIDAALRLGRTREASDADRAAPPLPLRDRSLEDLALSFSWGRRRAPRAVREGDVLRIVFPAESEAGPETELVVDVPRRVLLEERSSQDGRTTYRTRYADFVEVGGRFWATKVETFDDANRVTSRQTLKVEAVAAAEFDAAFSAAAAARADAVLFAEREPAFPVARRAVKEGRAVLSDHLAVALRHASRARWDPAFAALDAAQALAKDKPGFAWLRLGLLAGARRGPERLALARTLAARTAADPSPFAAQQAAWLDLNAGLAGEERLSVFEVVAPVLARPGPYAEAWGLFAARRHAQLLHEAGRLRAAYAERAEIARRRPFDAGDVVAHAMDLVAAEDPAAAAVYLQDRAAHGGPFTSAEANRVHQAWADVVWNQMDARGLVLVGESWAAAAPDQAAAHILRLSALVYAGRIPDADAWVSERLGTDPARLRDPVVAAEVEAAVTLALGEGWNLWANHVAAVWRRPLADLARRVARSDSTATSVAQRIVWDWRLRQTDEARALLADLAADVAAAGAVAAMPLRRLEAYVGFLHWAPDGVDTATWHAVVDGLLARRRAAAERGDRDHLDALVKTLLISRAATDERIAFLREVRAGVAPDAAAAAAAELFDALVAAKHDEAREDEAFSLLAPLSDVPEDQRPRSRAASAARKLAAWAYAGRREKALGDPKERAGDTRAAAVKRGRDATLKARATTAVRLGAAVLTADARLRPFLEVERLGYAAEAGADLEKVVGEARELLGAVPAGSKDEVDSVLARRSALLLSYAATRRTAPAGLPDRVVGFFTERAAAETGVLDARVELFRLLLALDRPEALEKALVAWVRPDEDFAWRLAIGYLQAETDRLKEAVATMEAADAIDDLPAGEWAAVAEWHLALRDDARRETALDRRAEALPLWVIRNELQLAAGRVARRGTGVPEELDPEALRLARVLLRVSPDPANEVRFLLDLYRPTKDVRVLEALADGVMGHTPEAVYAYVEQVAAVTVEVFEEATLDALAARLSGLLARATSAADRRGLGLLVATVEARAAATPKTDPRHGERARAALVAAAAGSFTAGERPLFAVRLTAIAGARDNPLAEEAVRRLEGLFEGTSADPAERLAVGRHVAVAWWDRGRHLEAIDLLEGLLLAIRAAADGTLPPQASEPYDVLIDSLEKDGRFARAEARLRADLEGEPRSGRRERLRIRLFRTYAAAVRAGATLRAGAGDALFRAAAEETERYLAEGPTSRVGEAAAAHADLHVAAIAARVGGDVRARYLGYVRDRLPAVMERLPFRGIDAFVNVIQRVVEIAGPRAALEAAIARLETDPPEFARFDRDGWQRLGDWMADWRQKTVDLGALEPRLLARVLPALAASLEGQERSGRGFWWRNSGAFWSGHAADFAATAARVADAHAGEPAIVLAVARYQRDGLGLKSEAVATLAAAVARGKTPEDLRAALAFWLAEDGRYAEALPLAEALVTERPENLDHRTLHAGVLFRLGRAADALRALEAAEAAWKARDAWRDHVAAALAMTALRGEAAREAVRWIEDALRMRREAGYVSTDDVTAQWYGVLARARVLLKDTDGAVRAASAAVVATDASRGGREDALRALHDVLAGAGDLDAWVKRHDAEAAATGEDAPTLRAALGRVYLERKRPKDAAVQFRAARDLDAADASVHQGLVQALDAAGDAVGAREALLVSLRVAPKNLEAYADLARRFALAGDEETAERARTSLVESSPMEPDGWRALARLREASERPALAVVAWRGVARVRPDEPEGWIELAKAQARSGDAAGARATIEKVLSTSWDERFGDVKAAAREALPGPR